MLARVSRRVTIPQLSSVMFKILAHSTKNAYMKAIKNWIFGARVGRRTRA